MLKGQKKIKHKELKQDKLVTAYFESKEWITQEENKRKIYIAVGILVAVIAVIYFYINNRNAKNEEAEAKLSSVISLYEANKYNESINGDAATGTPGLLEITNNYGSTEAGETAKFFLANSYYNIKDYDNALRYFEDYSGDNEVLEASSIAGVGSVYEAKGDLKKAAEYYERSLKVNKELTINQENIFYAIRAFNLAGDKENAKRLYDTMRRDYPKSRFISEVKKFESNFLN